MAKNKVFSGHQPNFLPYMGFLYKVFKSDVFVLDDDVQYSNDAFHNTNFLKVNGLRYQMIVPVSYSFGAAINDAKICYSMNWNKKLLKCVKMSYAKTKYGDLGYELLKKHLDVGYEYLADLNIALLNEIIAGFGFDTKIVIASRDVPTSLKNNERNVYQCLKLGCNVYYSGLGGAAYNDEELYSKNGIKLVYSDYKLIRYKQHGDGFIENLSVLDYICNNGYEVPEEWVKEHG